MGLNPTEALSFYVETYIERDVRILFTINELSQFQLFIKLCAGRVGRLLNLTSLGNECGVSHNTAKSWISILQASYIIFLLQPHYKNFSKRLVKTPKLYFYDVGLAAYLNEIKNPRHISNHPLRGELFENFVIADLLKQRYNRGFRNNFYFFRDNTGNEVDLLIDEGQRLYPVEIKSGKTIANDFFKGLFYYRRLNQENDLESFLIYGGDKLQKRSDAHVYPYSKLAQLIDNLAP
jgi:predicted AAA+ superfamily ATPase